MKDTPTAKAVLNIDDALSASACVIGAYVERGASEDLIDLLVTLPKERADQVLDAMCETCLLGVKYAKAVVHVRVTPTVKSILDIESRRVVMYYVNRVASDNLKDLLVTLPKESAYLVLDAMSEAFLLGVKYAKGDPSLETLGIRTKTSRGA